MKKASSDDTSPRPVRVIRARSGRWAGAITMLFLQLIIIMAIIITMVGATAAPAADHADASMNNRDHELQRSLAEMREQNERVDRELAEMRAEMQRMKGALRHETAEGRSVNANFDARASGERSGTGSPDVDAIAIAKLRQEEAEAAHREHKAGVQRVRDSLRGRYIVGLHDDATEEHAEAVREHMHAKARALHGADSGHVAVHRSYLHAMRGFAAQLTPEVKTELEKHEHVKYIAEDRLVFPSQYLIPTGDAPKPDMTSSGMSPQPWASDATVWHLDRLDQDTGGMSLDGHFDRGTTTGANVDVYVIDTGLFESHPEIAGRATRLFDVDGAMYDSSNPNYAADCSAALHGTAVASVAAGSTLGVAPNASVFGLKVFGRSSTSNPASTCLPATSDSLVIAGIDAAIASVRTRGRKAVVLLGLSSGVVSTGTLLKANPAYTDAFARLRATDVDAVVVTAAGNEYADACDATPGNSNGTINVGASDQDDYRAGFSNAGSCVTILAPGQNIRAAALKTPFTFPAFTASFGSRVYMYPGNSGYPGAGYYDYGYFQSTTYLGTGYSLNTLGTLNVPAGSISTAVVHGTSYAAALVAGVAALYRQANPSANVAAVQAAILQAAIPALDAGGLKGSPNRLLSTRGLNLPGATGAVRSPAYDGSLVQSTILSCTSRAETLAGRPSALHRTLSADTPWTDYQSQFHFATLPVGRSGVYLARVRVESDRRSYFPIFSAMNYTDISRPYVFIFAGNPAMQSYQTLASGIDGYGMNVGDLYQSMSLTNSDPFPSASGRGAFWIRPGTYYVLVEGLYTGNASVDNFNYYNGRGAEGVFRLDVTDSACPSWPNPLQSDGTCQYIDFLTCGRTMLVTSPSNSQGLNHTALFAKAGISTAGLSSYTYVPRDLVVRVQVPIGSSPPAFSIYSYLAPGQGSAPAGSWTPRGHILIMDNCPSSSSAHILAHMQMSEQFSYGGQLVSLPVSRDLLPGTYYVVFLMNAYNAYTNAPDTGPFSSYSPSTEYFSNSNSDRINYCTFGTLPPAPPSCAANVAKQALPYCGTVRSSLLGKSSVFGQAGSTAVFLLTDLQYSRRDPYISICSSDLDFVPTLYAYQGCPSDPSSKRLRVGTGCDMTISNYHAVTVGSPIYIVVEGVLSSGRVGNFSLTVADADCGGAASIPGSGSSFTSGSGGSTTTPPQQCFPLASLTSYYDVQCPPSITISRLAPVSLSGTVVCGAAMPDLKALLFAEWGANVSLTQAPASSTALVPQVASYPTNAAWLAAGLPTSGQGTYQVSLAITNLSGRGPRGTCAFPLTVLDTDGPFSRAVCPARSQEVLVATGECTAPAPDLSGGLQWDGSCMRPVGGPSTLVQSIAPGTPLVVGEKYSVRLYSSQYPNGAACPVLLKVRRATAPQITTAAGAASSSPTEIAGVVGGRPALVPVTLSYSLGDTCGDHAKACRLSVHATGDAAASMDGTLVTPEGAVLPLWNQTCAGDLSRVLLSPYISPSAAGAAGTVARTYVVALACAYDAGQRLSASWSIPVRRP